MGRISTGAKVGAALVACLAVPATVLLVVALGDLRDDDAEAAADLLDSLDAATAVSERLEAERTWYGFELTGTAETIDLPPGVDAGSPGRTDEAVEALRTALASQRAGPSAAYAPAFDALDTLDTLDDTTVAVVILVVAGNRRPDPAAAPGIGAPPQWPLP